MAQATAEDIRTWDAYLPELLSVIEDGCLDKHLRTLARALFARRDVITGTQTVVPDTIVQDTTANDATFAGLTLLATGSVLPYRSGGSDAVFGYGGSVYRKRDLIGKAVRIPNDTFTGANGKYNGMHVKVTGVGPARVKVIFLEDNAAARGRMRQAIRNGDPVFLPHTVLREVLA